MLIMAVSTLKKTHSDSFIAEQNSDRHRKLNYIIVILFKMETIMGKLNVIKLQLKSYIQQHIIDVTI